MTDTTDLIKVILASSSYIMLFYKADILEENYEYQNTEMLLLKLYNMIVVMVMMTTTMTIVAKYLTPVAIKPDPKTSDYMKRA